MRDGSALFIKVQHFGQGKGRLRKTERIILTLLSNRTNRMEDNPLSCTLEE